MTNACPIRIGPTLYPSIAAAARALNIHPRRILYALEKGDPDRVLRPRTYTGGQRPIPCTIDGIKYPSRKAAAAALGVVPTTISNRLNRKKEPAL